MHSHPTRWPTVATWLAACLLTPRLAAEPIDDTAELECVEACEPLLRPAEREGSESLELAAFSSNLDALRDAMGAVADDEKWPVDRVDDSQLMAGAAALLDLRSLPATELDCTAADDVALDRVQFFEGTPSVALHFAPDAVDLLALDADRGCLVRMPAFTQSTGTPVLEASVEVTREDAVVTVPDPLTRRWQLELLSGRPGREVLVLGELGIALEAADGTRLLTHAGEDAEVVSRGATFYAPSTESRVELAGTALTVETTATGAVLLRVARKVETRDAHHHAIVVHSDVVRLRADDAGERFEVAASEHRVQREEERSTRDTTSREVVSTVEQLLEAPDGRAIRYTFHDSHNEAVTTCPTSAAGGAPDGCCETTRTGELVESEWWLDDPEIHLVDGDRHADGDTVERCP